MNIEVRTLIGETTVYDKKEKLERSKPKSWLKSVSAFANGEGGSLVFGVSDKNEIVGLIDAEGDADYISEAIKTKLDPVPDVNIRFEDIDGKKLIILYVSHGQETPYYYIGDKQRLAYVRIGNESVVADRLQLKNLVMKSSGHTFDGMPSLYKFEDMAFSKLKSVHFKRLQRSFDDSEYTSWGIVDENGKLTNAGALVADESPMRQSRIFCTRWNGLTMTNGLNEAIDDVELSGSVIGQLQDAETFVRNNSRKKWWKEADHREEIPDYPERAVTEAIVNAIIHRDYTQMGSEVHIDMYDDRLEVYSPGGMVDGSLIQQVNPIAVPSKRRNPLLADFFNRLGLMERRGSGMKKILDAYNAYEYMSSYRKPEFSSNATEFHVTLWNLNYELKTSSSASVEDAHGFAKGGGAGFAKEVVKDALPFTKEFAKGGRHICGMILQNPQVSAAQMAKSMGLSQRQVQKYLKRLQEMQIIVRVGGRKTGAWKIITDDFENILGKR